MNDSSSELRDETHEAIVLHNWDEVTAAFDEFGPPQLFIDNDGELSHTAWVFRGHKSERYDLTEPRMIP